MLVSPSHSSALASISRLQDEVFSSALVVKSERLVDSFDVLIKMQGIVNDLGQVLAARPTLTASAIIFLVFVALRSLTSKTLVPESLPWIGRPTSGPFVETRASLSSFNNVRGWQKEGYATYSQRGKSYVFPDFSGRPEIVIPNNKTRWLIDKPDHVSSVGAAHYDILQGDYAFTDPYVLRTLYHEHVVHKNLARRLHTIIPGTWEELQLRFDETWGFHTTEWKDICVFENMMRTIAQASNRMFVGVPLCRNEDYLANMSSFAQDVVGCVMAMPFVPRFLAPIFGRLCAIPNTIHYRRVAKHTMPLIKQRLADIAKKDSDPDDKWEEPDDYITWHIRLAQFEGKTKELEPEIIAKFLMPLSFAAIHTTTFTITNTLFDLLGSDPTRNFMSGLREEAERIFKEENGTWTKAGLSRLVRADSAIRESMRVSNFLTRGVMRKIVAKEGLKNEEEGWTAPYGSYISVDVDSIHHDPDIYPNPYDYDAFRFSRPREEYEAKHPDDRGSAESLRLKNTGMISTGDAFLPFGHGRHACPGRFFVNHELKMLLAYMVMNYDVQYLPERPPNKWFGQNVVPDMKATIKVRRRVAK